MRHSIRPLLGVVLLAATPAWAGSVSGSVTLPGGKPGENAVVYLAPPPGKTYPAPATPATMDQKFKTYTPHVLPIVKGQHVIFPNTDIIRHNVFSPSKLHPFNLGIYPPGVKKEEVFDKPGVVALLCNVHPEMSAFIVVVETPYFALVGADGKYTLKDVPPGSWEVIAWHEGMTEARAKVEVAEHTQHDVSLRRAQ